MKIELQALKAKIRGFELEAYSIRRRINQLSGERRCAEWQRKRALGEYTREHLIAYGLLRGIPYERIEPKSVSALNYDNVLAIIHAHVNMWERHKWTNERLGSLLTRPVLENVSPPTDVSSEPSTESTVTGEPLTTTPVPAQVPNKGIMGRLMGLFQ